MAIDVWQGWQEYSALEPWGEERADLRAGIVASVIANVNRDPRKGRAFKPWDFMPRFGDEEVRRGRVERKKALTDPAAWDAMMGEMKQKVTAKLGGA